MSTLMIAFVIFLVLDLGREVTSECNHTNPDAFICLHIFLERDFPLIEEMLNRPNFIREGREFEEMCRSVTLKVMFDSEI